MIEPTAPPDPVPCPCGPHNVLIVDRMTATYQMPLTGTLTPTPTSGWNYVEKTS